MTRILKSKPVTDAIAADLAHRVERLKILGIEPTLAIVRVGSRPDDLSYERTACKRAKALGLTTRVFELDEKVSQEKLLLQIRRINADSSIHGCLVFRPLPSDMEDKLVCDELAMAKDIDGVSTASLGAVFTDAKEGFAPSTAEACVRALDFYDIPVEGKHVVVVGRSLVVGKPVAMLLLRRNASVTICHSRTEDLPKIMRTADIVICATGRARAFDASCFRKARRFWTLVSTLTRTATCAAMSTMNRSSPLSMPSLRSQVVSVLLPLLSPWSIRFRLQKRPSGNSACR